MCKNFNVSAFYVIKNRLYLSLIKKNSTKNRKFLKILSFMPNNFNKNYKKVKQWTRYFFIICLCKIFINTPSTSIKVFYGKLKNRSHLFNVFCYSLRFMKFNHHWLRLIVKCRYNLVELWLSSIVNYIIKVFYDFF